MSRYTIRVNDIQNLPFSAVLSSRIESAVGAALDAGPIEGPSPGAAEISVTLIDPPGIRELNARFHQVDAVTDVLAFGLGSSSESTEGEEGEGDSLLGDIYVCAEVAARFAEEHGGDSEDEIVRLAIHGTLHLLGHDHPEGADRYQSPMFHLQERLLEGLTPR